MHDHTKLMWVGPDGTMYRMWITPGADGRAAIHVADWAWDFLGSAPIDPTTEFARLERDELAALLKYALDQGANAVE